MKICLRIIVLAILAKLCLVLTSLGQSHPTSMAPALVPESGFLCSGKYTNGFFGFSLPLPKDPDLKVFSDSLKGPALSHFLISFASNNAKNTLMVAARTIGIEAKYQAQYDAAGPQSLRTRKIQIGKNTFWRSESRQKNPDGELQSLTFATELKGYVLAFYIASYDPKVTTELEQSIQSLTFFDSAHAQEQDGTDCKTYNPLEPQLSSRMAQLSDGVVSNSIYYNSELGFRYQIPDGWTIYDKAKPEELADAGRRFVWRGPFAEREHTTGSQCTKNLLYVTRYTEGISLNRFNPVALLIALDPKCAPGVTFPTSVKDREAIQRIAGQVVGNFKTPAMTAMGAARVRAFENAGRVMLEISQPFSLLINTPGNAATYDIATSLLLMQTDDYWVMWMLASDDEKELDKLRATKIFFNDMPSGSANP